MLDTWSFKGRKGLRYALGSGNDISKVVERDCDLHGVRNAGCVRLFRSGQVMSVETDWKVWISSPPDRERLVADIFFGTIQWAELNQENGHLCLEMYARPDGKPWAVPYELVSDALREAERRLKTE